MNTFSSYPIDFQSLFFISEEDFVRLESDFSFSDDDNGFSSYLFTRSVIFRCAFTNIPHEHVERFWKSFDDVFLKDSAFFDSVISKGSPDTLYVQSKNELHQLNSLLSEFFDSAFSLLDDHHQLFRSFLGNVIFYNHSDMGWNSTFQRVASHIHKAFMLFNQHYEQQSAYLLSCIKQSVLWKRELLELEVLAKRSDVLSVFEDYYSFQREISSIHESSVDITVFSSQSAFSRFIQRYGMNPSAFSSLDKPALSALNVALKNSEMDEYWNTVRSDSYSFGSFDETGVFTYSGKLNVLALIIHDVRMKGWSSSGDKVHRFLEHVRVIGKTTTLIKYLEMIVAGKNEVEKSSFHDEAVELFNTIIKNSE